MTVKCNIGGLLCDVSLNIKISWNMTLNGKLLSLPPSVMGCNECVYFCLRHTSDANNLSCQIFLLIRIQKLKD